MLQSSSTSVKKVSYIFFSCFRTFFVDLTKIFGTLVFIVLGCILFKMDFFTFPMLSFYKKQPNPIHLSQQIQRQVKERKSKK